MSWGGGGGIRAALADSVTIRFFGWSELCFCFVFFVEIFFWFCFVHVCGGGGEGGRGGWRCSVGGELFAVVSLHILTYSTGYIYIHTVLRSHLGMKVGK